MMYLLSEQKVSFLEYQDKISLFVKSGLVDSSNLLSF